MRDRFQPRAHARAFDASIIPKIGYFLFEVIQLGSFGEFAKLT